MTPNRETITVRVNNRKKEQLKELAKSRGRGVSALVRKLIEDELDRRGNHP